MKTRATLTPIKQFSIALTALVALVFSCNVEVKKETDADAKSIPLEGTWELLSETKIQQGDTTFTPADSTQRMIKIINATHFAFLRHDLQHGKDTATAMYVAGGGSYTLKDSTYTESLEYLNVREWEGHDFSFVVTVSNDTLIQQGREKIEGLGVDRIIIEKYLRVTK